MNRQSISTMISLITLVLVLALVAGDVAAFLPTQPAYPLHSAPGFLRVQHHHPDLGVSSFPKQNGRPPQTSLQLSYKSPDEENSYNDDAFGLIFLTGGILSQDVDFIATFASLSAIAAVGTKLGFIQKDERAPAAVAMLTLLILPVVSSLRQTSSLDDLTPPMPVEIGLCTISALWAFVNWSRGKEE